MGKDNTWFLETGFFNAFGNAVIDDFHYELEQILALAKQTEMTENQLRVLQSNLCKLIGDKINEVIIAKK